MSFEVDWRPNFEQGEIIVEGRPTPELGVNDDILDSPPYFGCFCPCRGVPVTQDDLERARLFVFHAVSGGEDVAVADQGPPTPWGPTAPVDQPNLPRYRTLFHAAILWTVGTNNLRQSLVLPATASLTFLWNSMVQRGLGFRGCGRWFCGRFLRASGRGVI